MVYPHLNKPYYTYFILKDNAKRMRKHIQDNIRNKRFDLDKVRRLAKILLLAAFVVMSRPLTSSPLIAETELKGKRPVSDEFDWTPVIEAIIQVESGGDSLAVGGQACGILQITPILVKECNLILDWQGSDKPRYTLQDRFSTSKSIEMFLLVQSYFNPSNDIEKAIRRWNGGPRYSKKATQRYYEKVMAKMG